MIYLSSPKTLNGDCDAGGWCTERTMRDRYAPVTIKNYELPMIIRLGPSMYKK
jgi:hypothetical protein